MSQGVPSLQVANRRRAMSYAMQFGRGLDDDLADRFVGMYVNDFTCDYGDEGRQAVGELLRRAEAIGAYEQPVVADHLQRDPLAGGGQRDRAVRLVLGELEGGELLHHRARRGRRDTLAAGQSGHRRGPALGLELVDLLEVVLDRIGEGNLRHVLQCKAPTRRHRPSGRAGLARASV